MCGEEDSEFEFCKTFQLYLCYLGAIFFRIYNFFITRLSVTLLYTLKPAVKIKIKLQFANGYKLKLYHLKDGKLYYKRKFN